MDALARPVCPCCHRPLQQPLGPKDLAFLPLASHSTVSAALIDILSRAWPRSVPADVLVEHVYASRPNGEPENAAKSVQVLLWRLRRRLAPYGWTITDARRSNAYRLERIGS